MGAVELEIALVLPVRVSLAWSAPAAVRLTALQLPVIPVGRPVTLKAALEALEAKETPPMGVRVAVRAAVDMEGMVIRAGESAAMMAGAAVTCTVAVYCAVRPSPVAVILMPVLERVAPAAAARVRVEMRLPSAVEVKELPIQAAVTPLGKPVTARVTAPEKEPPVVVVTMRAPD
jgi:hypothetical protein